MMTRDEKRRIMLAAALDYAHIVRKRASGTAADADVAAAAANLELWAETWATADPDPYRPEVNA